MKLVIEIKGKPMEGDILVFKNGTFVPSDIRSLLSELKKIKLLEKKIEELEYNISELNNKVKELRGED